MTNKEFIARRAARELKYGNVVNLGIGLPTLIGGLVDPALELVLQSENGFTGLGPAPAPGSEDMSVVNAGGAPVTILPGGACFDSAASFAMIRGGHMDVTVVGALQVDELGDIASWIVPGKTVPGMGGAMDLMIGVKRVIVVMEHTAKGNKKILKRCTYPLTAKGCVDMIITEMGVMIIRDSRVVLIELNPEYTLEQVQAATEAELVIADDLAEMVV